MLKFKGLEAYLFQTFTKNQPNSYTKVHDYPENVWASGIIYGLVKVKT